ncbi:MAG: hypothetical protein K8E24_003065 [Methanobacterium paludis]|nr:hypothetical protein [Methanobacterium paludis]
MFKEGDRVKIVKGKYANEYTHYAYKNRIFTVIRDQFKIESGMDCVAITDDSGLFGFVSFNVENLQRVVD